MKKTSTDSKLFRKLSVLLLAGVLAVALAACGSGTNTTSPQNKNEATTETSGQAGSETTAKPAEQGYYFQHKGVKLYMNAEVAPLIEQLGKEQAYFEAESCAFQGLDKIYTYAGFDLMTYPVDEVDFVASVVLMDDSVTTPEGLYIGAPEADIASLLGDDYTMNNNSYVYVRDASQLMVIAENGEVVSIEYTAITD